MVGIGGGDGNAKVGAEGWRVLSTSLLVALRGLGGGGGGMGKGIVLVLSCIASGEIVGCVGLWRVRAREKEIISAAMAFLTLGLYHSNFTGVMDVF